MPSPEDPGHSALLHLLYSLEAVWQPASPSNPPDSALPSTRAPSM